MNFSLDSHSLAFLLLLSHNTSNRNLTFNDEAPLPPNPRGTTYFEPTNIWHKYGRPIKSKTRRKRTDSDVPKEIRKTSRLYLFGMLAEITSVLSGFLLFVLNILTVILLLPIRILSLISKAFKKSPF